MIAVIARFIETKQVIGLLIARNLDELWDACDEITDPGLCEYKRIGRGMLEFDGDPLFAPTEEEEETWRDGKVLTVSGSSALFDAICSSDNKWKPFGDALSEHGLIRRVFSETGREDDLTTCANDGIRLS